LLWHGELVKWRQAWLYLTYHLCVWATVTKYYRLVGTLTTEIYFSQFCVWRSEIRGHMVGSDESSFQLHTAGITRLLARWKERAREDFKVRYKKALIPFLWWLLFMTQFTFPKSLSSTASHGG
jgi:hypothetical protein